MVDTLETPSLSLGTLRLANRLRLPHLGALRPSEPERAIEAVLECSQSVLSQARQLKAVTDGCYARPTNLRQALPGIADVVAELVIDLDLLAGICGFDLGGAVAERFNTLAELVPGGIRLFEGPDGAYTLAGGSDRGGAVTVPGGEAGRRGLFVGSAGGAPSPLADSVASALLPDGAGRVPPQPPQTACAADVPPPCPDTPVTCCAGRPWISLIREQCVMAVLGKMPDMHAPTERAWAIVRAADELTQFIVGGTVSEVEP